ncbi:hypothetical protein [Parvularcula oceani]|uniref:hypothetical protein n=1 Tax=Parvularcula oceani TaxID=1247963 RepID=UPI0012DC5E7F|nr:hypothetical protein [Parvularcula oceani]
MTALTIPTSPPRPLQLRAAPHLAGASLPPALRTVGALALLLAAVAVTGLLLVAFAVVMPVALLVAVVAGRKPRGERRGWRPAPA